MIEMILGAMVVALWVKAVPAAVADAITTLRASKAGEWGLIDKERDRKAARSKARRDAIASIRSKRHKQAGGDGKDYRPGAMAYLSDVYHGMWEDELEKRRAKRAARPPVGPDGKRPPVGRVDQAVEAKVREQRARTGYLGRVARLLIDPVGEPRAATPPTRTCPVCLCDMTVGEDCETCAFNQQIDQTAQQTLAEQDERRAARDAEGGLRIACPTCGETLIGDNGLWRHPSDSTCPHARRPDGGYHVPFRVKVAAADLYWLNIDEGRTGALGETQTARDLRALCGDQYPQHVYEQAAADAATQPRPPGAGHRPSRRRNGSSDGGNRCSRCGFMPRQDNTPHCGDCTNSLAVLRQTADAAWFQINPDGPPRDEDAKAVADLVGRQNQRGWTPEEINEAVQATRRDTTPTATHNEGADMNTATGDVHDVESCKNELTALADDLVRVDTALDVIDEAIRSAKAATEAIEAWLRAKNADDCVPGMSAALDALSTDRIKELMDAVAVARRGVTDTTDNLAPLEEANELIGGTDGSALNGR